MIDSTGGASQNHTEERDRQIREAALDRTIEQLFPASDPTSSDLNPDSPDAITPETLEGDIEKIGGQGNGE
jgi:hypothetical protein